MATKSGKEKEETKRRNCQTSQLLKSKYKVKRERENICNSLTGQIQELYIFRLNFAIISGPVNSCTNSPTPALSCEFNCRGSFPLDKTLHPIRTALPTLATGRKAPGATELNQNQVTGRGPHRDVKLNFKLQFGLTEVS